MFFRSLTAGLVALAATTMTVLFSAAPVEVAFVRSVDMRGA